MPIPHTYYRWRQAYARKGKAGLVRKKPIAKSHPRQLSPEVVEEVLHLRCTYHLGPQRITWYLERYHGVETSCSSVYRTLIRHGLRRLPKNVGRWAIHTRRYAKQVPGHHIQADVKFLSQIAAIVTPDTILASHRRLIASEWSNPRKGVGRPGGMKEIRGLVVQMA
jgi:hypothetical protein